MFEDYFNWFPAMSFPFITHFELLQLFFQDISSPGNHDPSDDLPVRRRKKETAQVARPHPPDLIAPEGPGKALPGDAIKRMEGDGPGFVFMADRGKGIPRPDSKPQLFPDLSLQAGPEGLTRLLLTTRELPVTAHVTGFRPF